MDRDQNLLAGLGLGRDEAIQSTRQSLAVLRELSTVRILTDSDSEIGLTMHEKFWIRAEIQRILEARLDVLLDRPPEE